MADESIALTVEDEVPAAEPLLTREADLQDIFRDAAPESPLESEGIDTVTDPAPAPTVDPNAERMAKLEADFQALHDQNVALTTRNNILQSQFGERAAPQREEAQPKPGVMAFADFKSKAATDPIQAIYDLVSQRGELSKAEALEAVSSVRGQASEMMQRREAFNSDRSSALAEFGEQFNSNPKFVDLAGKIYNQLNASSAPMDDGMRWSPGTMYAAAATAYAQMVKAGHITANPKVVQLRERKPNPQNPLVGSTGAPKDTKGFADQFSARDQAIQRKTAESMGITHERYLKIMEGLQKNDPSYGRG